ncbi:MAG: hypothetical protein DKINENOH_05626 [bacterium]|nr:hypothetical protein [bacterium]
MNFTANGITQSSPEIKHLQNCILCFLTGPNDSDYRVRRWVDYTLKETENVHGVRHGQGTLTYLGRRLAETIYETVDRSGLDDKDAAYYLNEGFSKLGNNDYDAANACFDRAIELDWEYVDNYLNNAIKQTPSNADAYFRRGIVKKAIEDLSEAIRLNPKHAEAYFNRAIAKHYYSGDLDGAIADYDQVIEINPNDQHAPKLRALAEMMKKKQEKPSSVKSKSEKLYESAAAIEDEFAKLMTQGPNVVADALFKLFDIYLEILDDNPIDEKALIRLYRVTILASRAHPRLSPIMSHVREHYTKRLESNPNDAQACVRICQIENIIDKDLRAGISWAEEALKIDPKNSDAQLELAHFYKNQKEFDKAKAAIDRAITLNPNNADAHAAKGNLLGVGNLAAAIAEYKKCYELDRSHLIAKAFIVTMLAKSIMNMPSSEQQSLKKLVGM